MNRNSEARWDLFDSEEYESHNYAILRKEDDWILQKAVAFYRELEPGLDVVDVGTGPNLTPILAALPRARTITVWEYSATNVEWLQRVVAQPSLPENWAIVCHRLAELSSEYRDPSTILHELRSALTVRRESIFALPREAWDVATMEFCAESITSDRDEFVRGCEAFVGAVRAHGSIFATFMERSEGYSVGDVSFPAVPVTSNDLEEIFGPHVTNLEITHIPISVAIRTGYTGMLLLTARINARRT